MGELSGYSKMHEKFIKDMKKQYADVKFRFNCGDELSAHKSVLAASSPVFNRMFNGELKEKGDVDIKDASASGFKEFLNFFYGVPMQLTIENVAEVLKLADKYDVEDCFPICIDFLKRNLDTDIVFGLYGDCIWLFVLNPMT